VRRDDRGEANISSRMLAGFEPEWGTQYTIEVTSSTAPRLIDVSAMPSLTLDRVVAEESVAGSAFRIYTIGPPWLGDDQRSFIDGQAFACADEAACQALDDRVALG